MLILFFRCLTWFGTGTQFLDQVPENVTLPNITIALDNFINSSNITDFNVTLFNASLSRTYMSGPDGLVNVTNITINSNNRFNITINSVDHLDVSLSNISLINQTAPNRFETSQARIDIRAFKAISNISIENITVIGTNQINISDNNNVSFLFGNVGLNTFNVSIPFNNSSRVGS